MEDKTLIYVAGNPDAYPLEYYDSNTQSYRGVIPQLLQEFSSQSGYQIVYYQPGETDRRSQLAENRQVDLLSGYLVGESAPENEGETLLFQTEYQGTTSAYCLYFTAAAPKALKQKLQAYLSTVSQEKISGLLVETAQIPQTQPGIYWALGSLGLAVILLATVLVLLIRRYRKKLRSAWQKAETDEVTGLGNLSYLTRYYNQRITDQNRILYQVIYFYVQTGRLRRISGGQETEEFLHYCAAVLQEYLKGGDVLAKVADHAFVLLKLTVGAEPLESWISTILDRIHSYTELYKKPFESVVYAGIYDIQPQDRDIHEIIFQASQAAYAAKQEGTEYLRCSRRMVASFDQERELQARIDHAFAQKEFQLYLQFYVDAQSFRVVGGEALTRWNHPQKGLLSPGAFIPLMERENRIGRLDYYCLQEVCDFLERLNKEEIHDFFISCNFSRETLCKSDFPDRVKEIMDRYTFPRELVILEITESAADRDVAQIQKNILELKKYGIRVALDDFGEGFTSFYDLQKYPIDGIKLDKGLVDQIMTPCGRSILNGMIQVGHELNMTILAEGVETDEQVRTLQEIYCDVIQGFRFFYPLPLWEAEKHLKGIFQRQDMETSSSV